jgi:hypothetical protein
MAGGKKTKEIAGGPVVAPAAATDTAKNSGNLVGKLVIAGFVSAVIITETFVFFFLVPSGEEVAALAESRLIAAAREIDGGHEPSSSETEKVIEFDLGTYSVSFIPPGADHNYRVEFRLFATVNAKDKEHLQALFDERNSRFRHRLILEIRNTGLSELSENQLGLIQRRILATSTEVLGEPILLSVGFNDYQVMED